jgi:hypothetical protein
MLHHSFPYEGKGIGYEKERGLVMKSIAAVEDFGYAGSDGKRDGD